MQQNYGKQPGDPAKGFFVFCWLAYDIYVCGSNIDSSNLSCRPYRRRTCFATRGICTRQTRFRYSGSDCPWKGMQSCGHGECAAGNRWYGSVEGIERKYGLLRVYPNSNCFGCGFIVVFFFNIVNQCYTHFFVLVVWYHSAMMVNLVHETKTLPNTTPG